ncbi:hypothetical protein SLS62_000686 [Diatrype stigma]|uniref:Uncharacterized protein n=1 Tax=Diatrype stigma TaxID=117547 RepID=A0AAN9V9R5_9PEZI
MEQPSPSTPSSDVDNELQPIQTRAANTDLAADTTLRLVVEKRNRFYLNAVSVRSTDSAATVIEKIRVKREEFFSHISLFKPLHELLWRHRIQIVTMSTFRSDIEGQPAFLEVIVRTREPCPELSFGYQRPNLLDPTEPFIRQYPDVLTSSLAHKALLVRRKLKKRAVMWFALVSLLVAVIIGVGVGVLAHDANIGTQIAGGIIGAVALLASLSIWIMHEG